MAILDSSEARKTAAPTMSSGTPMIPRGIMESRYLRNSGSARSDRFRSVSINPGAIALARIL